MIAALVFICGTVLIGYVSTRWPWVAHHSQRLGITLCGILVLAVLEYSRTNRRCRGIAIVALVIASLVTLIPVIDSDSVTSAPASPEPSATPPLVIDETVGMRRVQWRPRYRASISCAAIGTLGPPNFFTSSSNLAM